MTTSKADGPNAYFGPIHVAQKAKTFKISDKCNWQLKRYLPSGNKWYPSTDHLVGIDKWGDPTDNSLTWGKKYDHLEFNQFLFTTGDLKSHWAVMSREEAQQLTEEGATDPYPVFIRSSEGSSENA